MVSPENPVENFLGGILVTQFLKPDQSHLLQQNVFALVTNHGGLLSHPAILAREYRIPAIVGTGNATERIGHGARILVDAQEQQGQGKVVIMKT